jgi:hypothetical protein
MTKPDSTTHLAEKRSAIVPAQGELGGLYSRAMGVISSLRCPFKTALHRLRKKQDRRT